MLGYPVDKKWNAYKYDFKIDISENKATGKMKASANLWDILGRLQ